ncbi:hypothetical protein GUITHDRAFT_155119 [Guillardia theta CCMP2712]|uniref:Uncharacterized protein n=1 Tax=Guillardia theta (strain CCMP2712) TaxID=905079 RepID=L1IKN9_GUITC|nr:hypothetical protein GUITHDRAFT_155119 [Guillardia theta CCMP2712]EKX36808.1 hypothetical protein GUITHDRAFT_155119 [Guillardia theta CCMP2712]|mmetsp:Transcript_6635/g.23432  ORF Transcript_6635/g.23432 Transcript_6635/m.23432 type:complete len:105 (-) Transcript_6635:791-1105(-)|eukprot:XP_005823788.1 hypothetical protein GUITHDRAFT_155119 [Guillardia theta CCMP2712]
MSSMPLVCACGVVSSFVVMSNAYASAFPTRSVRQKMCARTAGSLSNLIQELSMGNTPMTMKRVFGVRTRLLHQDQQRKIYEGVFLLTSRAFDQSKLILEVNRTQ